MRCDLVTAVRCPNCWLGAEECTANETPPYEAVPGWVLCPRCPGGSLTADVDDEGDEAELARAIREAAKGRVLESGGPRASSQVGSRKRQRYHHGLARPEQELYAGPPPRELVRRDVVDPKTELLSFSVPLWVRHWIDAEVWRRGGLISDLVRDVLARSLEMTEPLDMTLGEKDKKTQPVSLLLTKGESSLLFRRARDYGVGARAFVRAALANAARSYRDEFSNGHP